MYITHVFTPMYDTCVSVLDIASLLTMNLELRYYFLDFPIMFFAIANIFHQILTAMKICSELEERPGRRSAEVPAHHIYSE